MAFIQELPNELILMLVADMPLSAFAALRQTSKRFNEVTIVTFGRRFFHTRNIMLHEKSVQNLDSIAKHPVFASCVRKVGFSPTRVKSDWYGFEEECEARRHYGVEEMTFENMRGIPQRLPATSFIFAVDQAFARLPNCNTISLTNAQRPWGLRTLIADELSEVQSYEESQKFKGRWFIRYLIGYIFTFSIKFGIENIELFADKVCHKPWKGLPCQSCSTIGISDICMARPAASSNLKSLKMTVHTHYRAWPNDAFTQLISYFPQLSSLTLDFDTRTYECLYFSEFKIPGLKELTLCCRYCHPSELADVIKRHEETLDRVAFHDIYLTNLPDWLLLMDVLSINQKPLFNMQFSTSFLVAALFGTALAMPQANPTDCPETSAIPTCGAPCITSAASAVGCSNIACQCASSSAIQASAINCVLDNCGFLEALQVQASAAAVCTACA
ncbi:Extracellular membrane protein, CFEM domain [Fusarium oxysporum f. sp. vasinfectum]|nr:Extracellular membrane protein, CFEM domain [Fusarium oxysporum f. sp. vasinfectum]